MKRRNLSIALSLAVLALPLGAQVVEPAMRAAVDGEIRALLDAAAAAPVVARELPADLPAPVRAYLRYTGADRVPPARFARFRFEGEVRLPITGDASAVERSTPWMRTQGMQYMVMTERGLGYVWDSRWLMGEDARIDVRDLYLDGRTHVWAVRHDGRVMVNDQHGELGRTYMLRFFAEATQSPTMLRPGRHLRWEAVDDRRARAVVQDGELQARMVCSFEPDGALTRCESDDRMLRYNGDVRERWVGARWVMTRGDYREMSGLRVPTSLTVSWQFPGGEYEQVRARTTAIDFDVLQAY